MSFLTGIAASVIEWLLVQIMKVVGDEVATIKATQDIKAQAEADKQKVQDAKTPQEIASVVNDLAVDTFKQ